MSQDVKPTRRAMLAGAAALLIVPITAAPTSLSLSDPIFAAIEAHRAAWIEFNAWCTLNESRHAESGDNRRPVKCLERRHLKSNSTEPICLSAMPASELPSVAIPAHRTHRRTLAASACRDGESI
jgi:hypothetical protein